VSLSVSAQSAPTTPALLRYLDVVLIVLAAPIMLLIGVSAGGYLIGAGVWIVLRILGVVVDRLAAADAPNRAVGLQLGYMLGRLFALAITVILVRKSGGQDAGLACLAVVVFAFTVQLVTSFLTRPRFRR
jgi:hypothetical protein